MSRERKMRELRTKAAEVGALYEAALDQIPYEDTEYRDAIISFITFAQDVAEGRIYQ